MTVPNRTREILLYTTWYDFKKELERHLGHSLLNWHWLEVKPQAPLPWDKSHLRAALIRSGLEGPEPHQRRAKPAFARRQGAARLPSHQ